MKKHLKRRCIGLCGSLLIGLSAAVFCAAPSSAAQYNDIEGHWAQSTIEKWSDSGILSGYPDGTFKPDRTVTRSELSSILYNVWGSMTADSYFNYPDVKKGDWYYDSLSTMNAYGIALNDGNAMNPGETLICARSQITKRSLANTPAVYPTCFTRDILPAIRMDLLVPKIPSPVHRSSP